MGGPVALLGCRLFLFCESGVMVELTAEEIGSLVGGEVRGDGARRVDSAAPLENASAHALSFVASARYLPYLHATRAGVVLVRQEWADDVPSGSTGVIVGDPHAALRSVLVRLYPSREIHPGIHPTAVIADSASIGERARVDAYAVIEEECQVGDGVSIGAHSVIGRGCQIGSDVTIHPHVTLYEGVVVGDRSILHSGARIGKPGFGYVWSDGGHQKVPQVGGCRIDEDVEVGTNVTIDRGSIGDTVVGAGSKIDNLVHLGHNVQLGRNVLLIAQVGISGSSTVGDGAVLAGQVGVAGHLEIGSGARVGAQAGVTSDVPSGETYSGYPARPHREALRAQAATFKLPEMMRRLKKLEELIFTRKTG